MSNTERTKEMTGKISANLLVATPKRHKTEIKHLTAHLAQTEASHKSQVEEFTVYLAKTEAQHWAQVEDLKAYLAQTEARHRTDVEQFNADLAEAKARYTSQVEGLVNHYDGKIEQLNERIMKMHRRKNILVIDHHLPLPDKDAGSVRMFHILNILHQLGHRVTFIPDNLANVPPYGDELQKRGIEIIYYPCFKKVRDYLISHGLEFDAVVLSRCDFARKHIADTRLYAPRSRIIFDTVDLHFVRTDREAQITSSPETREKARQQEELEYDLIDQADETWVVSSVEQKLLREARPDKSIEIVPTITEVPGSKTPFALRRDWLFIGGFQHTPNIDAVLFFAKDIWPLVSEHLHDAKFYIIGDKAPPEVAALASERIVVAGFQRDVRPFFDSVKLSVAPLRFGAGVKGKINQSMAFGVPVVATSLAIEGMELQDREDILVADKPEDFARALIELYNSEDLWNRISENGIAKTRAHYSTDAARKKLELLFSDEHLRSSKRSVAMARPGRDETSKKLICVPTSE